MVPMTTDTELRVINQSQVRAWRRCQREWDYKYRQLLVPKAKSLPLYKGSWVHACLETHYKQGDWKIGYQVYKDAYDALWPEQRLALDKRGPLPDHIRRIMRSYLWYYKNDGWTVHLVERTFDFTFRDIRLKGTIDLLVEDADGLIWLVDHKTASSIPQSSAFHAMDPQLMFYPWAAEKALGIKIDGVVWNYVKSKPPTIPQITRTGAISRRKIVSDYPTWTRFLRENGLDPAEYSEFLRPLRRQSPLLRRYRLPRETGVVKTVVRELLQTAREIYDHDKVVRNITKDCVRCSYVPLCQAELNGLDTESMRTHLYEIEDVTQKHGEYDPTELDFAEEERGDSEGGVED